MDEGPKYFSSAPFVRHLRGIVAEDPWVLLLLLILANQETQLEGSVEGGPHVAIAIAVAADSLGLKDRLHPIMAL